MTIKYFNLTGEAGRPEEVAAYTWSPRFSDVFQASQPMALGRHFLPGDDQPGKEQVVVLSNGLWKERFGADPQILGKPVYLDGKAYIVIGVLPANTSVFEAEAKLWIPLPILELKNSKRENRGYVAFGLLEPGLPQKQAQAEMAVISRNLAGQYRENEKWELVVEPMIEHLLRFMKRTMLVLHGAVGFVLLIACSIVASLLLARAATRQKEVSIRLALGATRRQIMRQMLTESVLLALCGGAFGLVLTAMGIQLLKSLLPPIVMDFVTRQGIDIHNSPKKFPR